MDHPEFNLSHANLTHVTSKGPAYESHTQKRPMGRARKTIHNPDLGEREIRARLNGRGVVELDQG